MSEPHKPSLRITGMHIERLRAIESLTLPEDGLGWAGTIPPVVLVGGQNGAGKTTLFEFIVGAVETLANQRLAPRFPQGCGWINFEVSTTADRPLSVRYVQGPADYFRSVATTECVGFRGPDYFRSGTGLEAVRQSLKNDPTALAGVLFLPSDSRDLQIPAESYKAPGKLAEDRKVVHRWRAPKNWKESLEALLYGLRWEELNAQAEGRANRAFTAYAEEYSQLTGGANRLVWHDAVLMVEVGGQLHPLEELSSGEKQVLLLLAELRRHWWPGTLVLIDEPELHLHDVLQARLYDRLLSLQRERGGQVWLATQSGYLFEVAEPNTRVILKRKSGL